MSLLIILFGVLVLVASITLVIRPTLVTGMMESNAETTWLYAAAIVARLVLGWLLIQGAAISKFPTVISVLGWIALIAAFVFLAIGHGRFVRLIRWVVEWFKPWSRIGGIFGVIFGAFLIYAFV